MKNKGVVNVDMQLKYDSMEIVKKVYDNGSYEVNICRSYNDDKALYTVICLKEVELFKEEIKFFSKLREKKRFTDFVACYGKNSFVYIWFIYREEAPILLEEMYEKSVIERADFIKAILSYIVVADIPEIMIYDLLSKENINKDKSERVYFNYFLTSLERYSFYGEKRYMTRLSNILRELFNEEIIDDKLPRITLIIDKLKSQVYSEVMEIYLDFVSLYNDFNLCKETEINKKCTLIKKVEKILIKLKEKFGLAIVTIILSVAVSALIVIATAEKQPKNISTIDKIGTRQMN